MDPAQYSALATQHLHSGEGLPLDLSVVIPAYNEQQRLRPTLAEICAYLDARSSRAEVLIVENGSVDRTGELADELAQGDPRVRAFHLVARGKGRAVRHGVLASVGQRVLLCDADLSMPVEEIDLLLGALEAGADIAAGSREAPGSRRIGEPLGRHLMGRVFNGLVQWLAVPGVNDTQCGFKGFRGDVARELFRHQLLNGWAFDVEVLYLARRRGYRIVEVPITWRYDRSTRVQPLRDTIAMVRELGMIRWNAMRGLYG